MSLKAGDYLVRYHVYSRIVSALVRKSRDLSENLLSDIVNYAVYTSHLTCSSDFYFPIFGECLLIFYR